MFFNNLKIILRSLGRNRVFSAINVLGLSIGISCVILISLYVADEYSFDRHHANTENIYQVVGKSKDEDGNERLRNEVPNLVAPTAVKEIPGVAKAFRILYNNFTGKAFVTSDKLKASESRLVWTDNDIFHVLSFHFLQGNPKDALTRPNTVVLTESAAMRYFSTTDIIGKSIRIDDIKTEFEITGVVKDSPENSRFRFPVIASYLGTSADKRPAWSNASFETYFLLDAKTPVADVTAQLEGMLARNIEKEERRFTLELHPLKDIHLQYSGVADSAGTSGDLRQLQILGALGLVILVIAAVNYMNLSTAQSQRRFKEIGVNKTLGASRRQLGAKFYLETSLFVLLSLILAVVFSSSSIPFFNQLTGKHFTLSFISSAIFWLVLLVTWIVLTLGAGLYPAVYLSSVSAREVIQGASSGSARNASLRKTLVVVQFAVSTTLIICTLIFYQQLRFIRNKNLGYKPEQVVAIRTTGNENSEVIESLTGKLQRLPAVSSVSRSQSFPGEMASGRNLRPLAGGGDGIELKTVRATPEILQTLGIRLLAGTAFPEKKPNDTSSAVQVVLNKSSVDFLGLTPEEAVNRNVRIGGFHGIVTVTGVTEDFHFNSLRQPITAYCLHNAKTEWYQYVLVKLETKDLPETMARMEKIYKETISNPFEFIFLDQHLQNLYQAEHRMAEIILLFSGLAIFIACLGLYALAAFSTEQRTKEIGMRKVLGASVVQLSAMLTRDFIKLVAISFVIAVPSGYFIVDHWLSGFSYQISISPLVFVLAGTLTILLAWFTVAFESVKAALSNPIKALRTE